ncbi:MAG: alkaline phosphatase family protein [Bacteroidota bacterium]
MQKRKVLLLGWDAADWKVINPLLDQGLMPSLESLINRGVMGKLATLDPSFSPMLWSSIATGKRPYKHGVHGFIEVTPDGNNVRPVMSVSRSCRAIWNILTLQQKKTHVVGWWPSHPAEPINGVMISNFFQKAPKTIQEEWKMASGTVHPEALADHFAQFRVHPQELTGQHIIPFVPEAANIFKTKGRAISGVASVTAHAASLHAAFTNILRMQEWDFAALYLDAIDHYCHGFMKYHPPKRPHIPQADFDYFKDVVTSGYRFHDMMLGRILELVDDDTTIMLVSDHGFQPDHLRPRNIPKEPAGPAYEHSPYGIFVAAGPDIKKDELIFGASIIDVTPTLLKLFDLPVGEDMDGKVLDQIFETPKTTRFIPSWEEIAGEDGRIKDTAEAVSDESSEMAMKQLEDLGYIEKMDGNAEQKIKNTRENTQYNLARAYIDGGKIAEGRQLLQELTEQNPDKPWYWFRLAIAQQMSAQPQAARESINRLKSLNVYEESTLNLMEASLLISEGKAAEAIPILQKIEAEEEADTRVNLQLARCYQQVGRWKSAEKCLRKELEYDPDTAQTHHLLAQNLMRQQEYEAAAEAALDALRLDFNQPSYHFTLGRALYDMGAYEDAAQAIEKGLLMQPQNNAARELLKTLYKNHLKDLERYDFHRLQQKSQRGETIYIVSGLPRSGTSMTMQMLQAGGLPIYTDEKREADENNQKGYLEHEAVKSLTRNKRWVREASGQVVKVITQLLKQLPLTFNYKIIYMERDLTEVLSSQQRMLQRLGKKVKEDQYPLHIATSYEQHVKEAKKWASERDNVQILYLQYADVVNQPLEAALKMSEFVGEPLQIEKMIGVVDQRLYRERTKR